ncbi:hypothetical protein B7486_76660 [cyanobacterium TDX16]|nr:hypothetical protein B7486_76660 [cyanobacterium TDX16]
MRSASGTDQPDALYGCADWRSIVQRRRRGQLTPEGARTEFVNLYRWRLETTLEYKTTHALELTDTRGVPVYTMVFATDHDAGNAIMSHVYGNARVSQLPGLRGSSPVQDALFDDPGLVSSAYRHTQPWKPPVAHADLMIDPPDSEIPLFDPQSWGGETTELDL